MTAPKIYVATQSLELPGGVDATLEWSASYDPSAGSARYRIFQVTGFSAGTAQVGTVLVESDITLSAASAAAWNREEVGYGWPTNTDTIPDLDGGSNPTPNGLYAIQIRPTTGSGGSWADSNLAFFVVRRTPTATDKVLVCYPFSTTVAYAGTWGAHGNLYDSYQWQRTRRVSRDRPLGTTKQDVTVEFPFAMEAFLRAHDSGSLGVDVCTSFDLQEDPDLLSGFQLFVSVGHDEYWSKTMSDRVKAFVAEGGNVAFFSANTAWWQVRFENGDREMVCFKSGTEDLGTDTTELTGNFCSPPSVEENTLTGVSYRRGSQGSSSAQFQLLGSLDPYGYLTGVSSAFGPSGIFTLETDATDYEARSGTYLATGADGSPLNFEVLATASMPTAVQRGSATLGYYTNVGTVFTAATTHWAKFLGDTAIAAITTNVVADPRSANARSAWTLSSRTYPSTTWSSLGTITGTIPAICGMVQGHLVFQTATTGTASRRDPENPTGSSSSTQIPARSDLVSYGADLWGELIFAGASDGTIYYRSGDVTNNAGWSASYAPPEAGWSAKGVGGHNKDIFLVLESGTASRLYHREAAWIRLSRLYPPIRPITSFDGKLFGVRDPGTNDTDPIDLYCREASEVDLTWTKIGTAPAGTYALAAYYGRLFALAGTSTVNPTLYWRSTLGTSSFPYVAPSLLFFSGSVYNVARVSSNGDVETTGSSTLSFSYTHVTRANDGLVFFYNSTDRSARIGRFAADGTYTNVKTWSASAFGTWTHIIHLRAGYRSWTDLSPVQEKVLFYNSSGTTGIIGYFDATTGNLVAQWSSSGFATGWTKIVCTYKGDLFFYNGTNGDYAYGAVDNSGTYFNAGTGSGLTTGWDVVAPAGHTYLFFYKSSTGTASLVELFNGVSNVQNFTSLATGRLVVGVANGLIFSSGGGDADVFGFRSDTTDAKRTMRSFSQAFSSWSLIVPVGIL